jgi:hypothetical protein
MEKLQTGGVAGCIFLSSVSENSLWRQNRLFLSVTWCVCVCVCVCVWEALNTKGLSNTCLPLLYNSIFWNKRKVKTRKSKQKIEESEREIRRECSEAWNEFRYSINKSWVELYSFIVQPTLKSPGISFPGSAGIQRAPVFNICQYAMRHSTAEESSMHFFSFRILNNLYRAGYTLQISLLVFWGHLLPPFACYVTVHAILSDFIILTMFFQQYILYTS